MDQSAQDKYVLRPITGLGHRRKAATQRDIFNFLLPTFQESAKVLEVGPGRGEFAQECLLKKLSYVGIEPSRQLALDLEHQGLTIMNQTIPPISSEDEQFDLVHSYDFIEHLCSYVDVMEFFSESYRVLKPGGYVSVLAPNYLTLKHLFFQYEYQHSYIVTKDRVKNILMDCGFEIVIARCYLLWLSPNLNFIDRLLAHTTIPLATNSLMQGLLRLCTSEEFVFKVLKNLYDHVAILAKKPM